MKHNPASPAAFSVPANWPARLFGVIVLVSGINEGRAQTAAEPTATGDIVSLSPFNVDVSNDKGYLSTNSLAVTRLNDQTANLPVTVQIINPEMINDLNITSSSGMARYIVGGTDNGAPVIGNPAFHLRGFTGLPDDQQRDGFRFTGTVDLYNVDRIEVILGPNSVVEGAADPGGQVNVITKSALTHQNFTTVSARVGNFGSVRGSIDENISAHSPHNDFALRANLLGNHDVTFIKYSDDNTFGVALAARDDLGRKSSFQVKYEYEGEKYVPAQATPDRWSGDPGLNGGLSQSLNRLIPKLYNYNEIGANAGPDAIVRRNESYLEGEFDQIISPVLNFQIVGQGSIENTPENFESTAGPTLGYDAPTNSYYMNRPYGWNATSDHRENLRALLNYDLQLSWTEQKFIFGYSLYRQRNWGETDAVFSNATNTQVIQKSPIYPGAITPANYDLILNGNHWAATGETKAQTGTRSYYVNSTGSYLHGRLFSVLGVSFNQVFRTDYTLPAASGSFFLGTASWPGITKTLESVQSSTDPMYSLLYHLTPELSIYADYSVSFKPQSGATPTLDLSTGQIGPGLPPVKGSGEEAGFKFDFKNGLSGTVDVFDATKVNNPQLVDTNVVAALLGQAAALAVRYSVAGVTQENKGAELQLFYNPSRSVSVMANAAYVSAYDTKSLYVPSLIGQVTNTFKTYGNVLAKYTNVDGPLKGWFYGADVVMRGRLFRYQANEYGTNASYAIFGAFLGYSSRIGTCPYTVQLNADNIFNKIYIRTYAEIGEPFTANLSLTIRL